MTEKSDLTLEVFLTLRRHLRILHHIPGRIRLKVAASVREDLAGVDRKLLDRILGAIDGIKDVRVNAMAGSVVIRYRASEIRPSWWEALVEGAENQAIALLEQLLETKLAPAVEVAQSD